MDQRLAVHAEIASLHAFGDEAVGIAKCRCRRRRECRARRPAPPARRCVSQGSIGARPGSSRAEVSLARSLVPITKPDSRVSESRRRRGDIGDVEDRERGLDHRPDPGLAVGAHVEQAAAEHFELLGIVDLRHQDRIGRGMRRRVHVVGVPGRIDAVDADEDLAAAEAAGLHRRRHLRAGLRLGVRRHRVFEIENDAVGRQAARLLDGAGVGARHIEHGSARSNAHVSPLVRKT